MGSEDEKPELIAMVMHQRAKDTLNEIKMQYPLVTIDAQLSHGRGIITLYQDRFVLSKEFVETAESLDSPQRMAEYRRILRGKARLVLVVPKIQAVSVRMRLLDFNNWWLFYYQVFFYDEKGNIKRVDRKTWCELMGQSYEAPSRAPEIV